ncbi:putative carbohydrate binding protein [Rhizobium sp. CF122]|uniref:putative carbohydrate binding protein n=1 Tax=Rhizobium sp. CF122 TaxID=1144312 RepID=UPI000271A02C|nr:putative carbohydrate binding protein [Rhizobium sp. CF122]EJL57977.1 putative carbohydrate binding protein [Rhizobium sp. CF122]
MTTAYTTGQITLTNGSAVVTGIGTAWATALIAGGFISAQAEGNLLLIETVDSNTQITALIEWAGATGTYDYVLVRDTAYLQQLTTNANTLAELIAELAAGTIFKFDASGDLAGRASYNDRAKGFSYLVIIGVTQPQLYVKASATSGDWAGPFAYGAGPVGPMGPAGYANPRGTYSAATAYARNDAVLYNGSSFVALQATTGNAPPTLPTTANAYWQLTSIKGTDGTGTGDVVGPTGGVADGDIVAFDTTTGKLIKKAANGSIGNALLANMANATIKGRITAGSGAPENLTPEQARGVLQVDILSGFRNKLINGDFFFNQRGAASYAANAYTFDRWFLSGGTGSANTISRVTNTPAQNEDSTYTLTWVRGTVGSAASFLIQRIEDVRTLANTTITVTFDASAAAATDLSVALNQFFGTGGSPSASVGIAAQTVALTTVKQRFSLTFAIPSINGKTIGTNLDSFLEFYFFRTTTQTNPTTTINISRVSVVKGDATRESDPFSPRHPQQENALCQRYYQVYNLLQLQGYNTAGNLIYIQLVRPVPMRAGPTNALSNLSGVTNVTTLVIAASTQLAISYGVSIVATGSGGVNFVGTSDAEL